MKKITLLLFMLGFAITASAQYVFDPIVGPTNVAEGSPVTINLNDIANSEGVPASSTGTYDSFSVSADWVAGGGNPYSAEADLTVTTTGGSVLIDPPTTSGSLGADAVITFVGDLPALYDPTIDGYLDIILDQSWGGSDANWSNIEVTLFESPTCVVPSGIAASNITSSSSTLDWMAGESETIWNVEYNSDADFTPGNGEEENAFTVNDTPTLPLTGLNAITEYYVYYQSDCGATNGLSEWVGPFVFETLCDAFVPDYIENFETVTFSDPPECWDEADSGDATTGPTDLGAGSWTSDGFLNNGTSGAYKINLFAASKSDWILSPLFDLTGGPFQVEFDFAITNWNSSTVAGTLGSDDTVQLLITNDGGATWTPLLTYDNTSVISISGAHPVIDLTAYSGQSVQFGILASEGTENDPEDVDVFVDNFRVRNIPTCPEPTELMANNITLTSAEIGWTENGGSTSWNIEYGEANFVLGEGTLVTDVSTNPYEITGLTQNTSYEFYVQAICTVDNLSSWSGPFTFETPIQTDFVLDCTNGGPLTQDYCYDNDGDEDPVIFTFTSNDGTELNLNFNSGFVENNFDELVVLDSDGTPFDGFAPEDDNYGAGGNIGGLSFQSTGDTISFYINSEGSVSCVTGSFGNPQIENGIDYTVSCATCINPQASYAVIDDCDNGEQFLIDVDIASLGDATSLTISNNINGDTTPVTATGVYQVGPFPFLQDVVVTVSNDQDANCVVNSQPIQLLACPPDNDNCSGAITAAVNDDPTCDVTTPGTILAATPSGVPNGSCTGNPGDDVWFEFTALNEVQIISIINITGGTTNLDHAIYEGSCGSLTEIACSDDDASVTPELTVGNTYYIRVFSGGSDNDETSTFDLCIREAPNNIICENAENFCSVGGALSTPNIIGIPDPNDLACLGTAPNPVWNIIQIGETGPIEIEINQFDDNGNGLDVDFAIWGPFDSVEQACTDIAFEDCPTCPFSNNPDNGFYPFGNIVDCSYSGAATENLSIDNAQEDEIYLLLVTNFNGGAGTITIEQTNLPDTGSGTIDAEISAEIGSEEVFIDPNNDPTEIDEVSVCGFDSVTIEADSPFADSYIWFKDGVTIEGETSSTLTVTESNNYQVQAFDNQCGDDALSQIVIINLYQDPGAIPTQSITVCDSESGSGEEFDLGAFTAETLNLGDQFTVSYYTNMDDANQRINAVGPVYNSTGEETLLIRVEDSDAIANDFLGCRSISELDLIVGPEKCIFPQGISPGVTPGQNDNFDLEHIRCY